MMMMVVIVVGMSRVLTGTTTTTRLPFHACFLSYACGFFHSLYPTNPLVTSLFCIFVLLRGRFLDRTFSGSCTPTFP